MTADEQAHVTHLRNTARGLRERAALSIKEAEEHEDAANLFDPPTPEASAPAAPPPKGKGK